MAEATYVSGLCARNEAPAAAVRDDGPLIEINAPWFLKRQRSVCPTLLVGESGMTNAPESRRTINLRDPHEVSSWARRVRIANKQLTHLVETLRLLVLAQPAHDLEVARSSISKTGLIQGCLTAWRACQAALALALFALFAASAAIAQSDLGARTARSAAFEKRILDIVQMFESDPRYNRGRTPQQIKDAVEFVAGNVLFVLAHETGHALMSVFELPVLGREEDAADSLATVLALKMANPFAERVVVNAARSWFLNDQRYKKRGRPTLFYDEHGPDLERAYNIVCLLVGGRPDKFTALADEVKLPKERQATCHYDFSNASWSWEEVLKPHLRKPEDPKTHIEVNYAPTTKYVDVITVGRKLEILETVAQWLSDDFVWKTPILLEMQQCGDEVSTRWLPTEKKIVVCYEMVREYIQLYRQFGQLALVPGTMKVAKYAKTAGLATPDKSRRSNAFRSARVRLPREMRRDENPGGGM
jgi:hypothetical protein